MLDKTQRQKLSGLWKKSPKTPEALALCIIIATDGTARRPERDRANKFYKTKVSDGVWRKVRKAVADGSQAHPELTSAIREIVAVGLIPPKPHKVYPLKFRWTAREEKAVAQALARSSYFLHPDIVKAFQEYNRSQRAIMEETLPPGFDFTPYLYDGSACVFPGVRRKEGYEKRNSRFDVKVGAVVDANIFPKHAWAFIVAGRRQNGKTWRESGLGQFELAHGFSHKPKEAVSREESLFRTFKKCGRYGLFTCLANVALVPKGMAKPTDSSSNIRLVFLNHFIELYGEGFLPGMSGFKKEKLPSWHRKLIWADPVKPDDWGERVQRLAEFRIQDLRRVQKKAPRKRKSVPASPKI